MDMRSADAMHMAEARYVHMAPTTRGDMDLRAQVGEDSFNPLCLVGRL